MLKTSNKAMPKTVITVDDIRQAQPGSTIPIPLGAIVTDLARELAQSQQISFVENSLSNDAIPVITNRPIIAIGSDHGSSFPMKEALKPY